MGGPSLRWHALPLPSRRERTGAARLRPPGLGGPAGGLSRLLLHSPAGGRLGRAYGLAAAVDASGGASRPPTRSEHGHLQMDGAKATSNPSAVGWSRSWGTGPAAYKPGCWSL